mgnify:CR=1 FL=1
MFTPFRIALDKLYNSRGAPGPETTYFSILAFSIFSAAIVSACAAVLARPSCNILLLECIS